MLQNIFTLQEWRPLQRTGVLQPLLQPAEIRRQGLALTLRLSPRPPMERERVQILQFYQTSVNRQSTYLFFAGSRPPADPSRPIAAARSLLKIVTRESTLRVMEPFYSGMVRKVLKEEQREYKSRPNKAIGLIWSLFGRENAFQTLTRFYLSAVERMGSGYYTGLTGANTLTLASGVILQSRVYQRYATQVWRSTLLREHAFQRYALREAASSAAGYLHRLPLTGREALEQDAVRQVTAVQRDVAPPPAAMSAGSRITEEEMRYIVKNVSAELEKRVHFDALRRGRRG